MKNTSLEVENASDSYDSTDIAGVDNWLTDSPIMTASDTAAMLNHEVRTSINAIMGFAQILGHGMASRDEIKSCTDMICAESEHLLYIFNELIDLPLRSGLLFSLDYKFENQNGK